MALLFLGDMEQENQLENYTAAIDAHDSETAAAVAEQPEHVEEQRERSNEVEEYREQRRPRKNPKNRIDKLTAEKYELQQRAERAEQQLKEFQAKPPQREEPAHSEPAREEASTERKVETREEKPTPRSETENGNTRLAAVRERHSDFDQVIKNAAGNPIPDTIISAAQQAGNREELAYFFAKNPDLCKQLMEANPTAEQARSYVQGLSQDLNRVHAEQDFKRFIADNPQHQETLKRFNEAGAKLWEDKEWQAVAKSNPNRFMVGRHVIAALLQLENGPALGVHILRNPEICDRLRTMNPERAMAEIGRLSAELDKKPEKSESKAPAPITPVGGGSGRNQSIALSDDMSLEEYSRARKSGAGRY